MTPLPNASLTAQAAQVATQPTTPTNDDYLGLLVGDGKKYKDQQELAKAYIHASTRIKELDEAVGEAKEHERLFNEILTEIRSKTPPNSDTPPLATAPTGDNGQITPDNVERLVEQTLSQREAEREAVKNQGLSIEKMAEAYGVDAQGAYRIVAEVLKVKPNLEKTIDNLGNTDPDAFVRFMTSMRPVTQVVTNAPGTSGGPSANSLVSTNGMALTWTQARELRKKDPKTYASKEFRIKLEQAAAAALAKGIDFYNT